MIGFYNFHHYLNGFDWVGDELFDCWATVDEWMNKEKKYIYYGLCRKHALQCQLKIYKSKVTKSVFL